MLADIGGYLQIDPWPPQPDLLFFLALTLIVGGLIGELAQRWLRLPRIVGYGAVGVLIAWAGFGLPGGRMSAPIRVIVDLALALLLFELGARVRLSWLRANPALLWTSAAESVLSFAAVVFVLRQLGLDMDVAVPCATLTVAASASVVGRVATEMKAAGQVTERMVMFTALNTLYAVLCFKVVSVWLHLGHPSLGLVAISQPLYTFCGSVVVAALLARLVAWVARRLDLRDENSVLLLLGLVVLALTTARMFNLSTLLVPLMAGVVLRNTTERPWVWPRHFGTAGGVLVLALFVIVGAAWSMQAVATGGLLALALLGARLLAKSAAICGLARWSGISLRQGMALTLAMAPISGTALVLLADLQLTHPESSAPVTPVVLSAIAFMELIGPIAVQWALRMAGEEQPRERSAGT